MNQNQRSAIGPVGPELLGQVFERHAAALEFYARQWCANPEDVVQEALVLLAAEPQSPQDVVAWLYHVVRARAINASRAATRRKHHETRAARHETGWLATAPGDILDAGAAAAALARLPAEEREVLIARIWSGLTFQQIGRAVHKYIDAHGTFPPPTSFGPDGKPLLSWRVHILPYLDQQALYAQFHLDEPWDSVHNRRLTETVVPVYRSPISKLEEKWRTNYLLPVRGGAIYSSRRDTPKIGDITDGTCNTILAVEVDDGHAVPWTKPEDLTFDPKQPENCLTGVYPGGFLALFADASATLLELPANPAHLRALFTRAGGEVVDRR